jgi:hypothetical protein
MAALPWRCLLPVQTLLEASAIEARLSHRSFQAILPANLLGISNLAGIYRQPGSSPAWTPSIALRESIRRVSIQQAPGSAGQNRRCESRILIRRVDNHLQPAPFAEGGPPLRPTSRARPAEQSHLRVW